MNEIALVPQQALVPADVFKPGGVDELLKSIAEKARAYRPDVSTPKGRSEIASIAYKVAQSKTLLDGMGKDLAAEWKQHSSRVDAERRRVRDFLDALKDEVRAPLTEYETAEEARIAGHEAAIAAIVEAPSYGQTETVADFAARLAYLRAYPARDWQEFARRAADTIAAEIARAEALHEAAVKREAEQAELARLRAEAEERARQDAIRQQAEREARIAAEAAEAARVEAERRAAEQARAAAAKAEAERLAAEKARQDAEAQAARAEAARLAAAEKAEADAAALAARVEAERAAAAERAERERIAAVEAERKRAEREAAEARRAAEAQAAADATRAADRKHRGAVNSAALAALVALGVSEEHAKAVVLAIVAGSIPNVSIRY